MCLDPQSVNAVAKRLNPKVPEYKIYKARYLQLFAFALVAFSIMVVQNTLYPRFEDLKKKHLTTDLNINAANILYLSFFGLISYLLSFQERFTYLHLFMGVALTILGAFIRTFHNLDSLWLGQAILAIGRPFVLMGQNQLISEWFPPQERQKAHAFLLSVYLAGNIFGFIQPTLMDLDSLFIF